MTDSVYEQNVFLRGRVDTLENIVASLQAKAQRADGLEARLLKLEQELASTKSAIHDDSTNQIDELKATKKLVNELAATVQSLERRLAADDADPDATRTNAAASSLNGKRKRVSATNDGPARSEANIEHLQSDVAAHDNDIGRLNEQMDDIISQLDHLEHYYDRRAQRIGSSVEDLEKHSESQMKWNDEARGQLKTIEEQVTAKVAIVEGLKSQLENVSTDVTRLQQASKRLDTAVSQFDDRCDSKTELNEGLKVKVEALEESLINTTKKLEKNLRKSIRFRTKKVDERVERLEGSIEERMAGVDEFGEELEDLSFKARAQGESIESINGKVDLYHYDWQKVQRAVEELKKGHDVARLEKLERETKATLDAIRKDVEALKKARASEQAMAAAGVESLDE